MAKSVIPDGKKRVSVLLTEENYEWLQEFITKTCKLPRSQMSVFLDSLLEETRKSIQMFIDRQSETGRELTHADLMIVMGRQIQRLGEEQMELKENN